MDPIERNNLIDKADELVSFANKIFNEKKPEMLRKAADLYRKATLSFYAELIEKQAKDWEEHSF
jgi:hypothetical protein